MRITILSDLFISKPLLFSSKQQFLNSLPSVSFSFTLFLFKKIVAHTENFLVYMQHEFVYSTKKLQHPIVLSMSFRSATYTTYVYLFDSSACGCVYILSETFTDCNSDFMTFKNENTVFIRNCCFRLFLKKRTKKLEALKKKNGKEKTEATVMTGDKWTNKSQE